MFLEARRLRSHSCCAAGLAGDLGNLICSGITHAHLLEFGPHGFVEPSSSSAASASTTLVAGHHHPHGPIFQFRRPWPSLLLFSAGSGGRLASGVPGWISAGFLEAFFVISEERRSWGAVRRRPATCRRRSESTEKSGQCSTGECRTCLLHAAIATCFASLTAFSLSTAAPLAPRPHGHVARVLHLRRGRSPRVPLSGVGAAERPQASKSPDRSLICTLSS